MVPLLKYGCRRLEVGTGMCTSYGAIAGMQPWETAADAWACVPVMVPLLRRACRRLEVGTDLCTGDGAIAEVQTLGNGAQM